MHKTTVRFLSACNSDCPSRLRRLWEPMEMMTVSALSSAASSAVDSATDSGSVSRSFCRVVRNACMRGDAARPYRVTRWPM